MTTVVWNELMLVFISIEHNIKMVNTYYKWYTLKELFLLYDDFLHSSTKIFTITASVYYFRVNVSVRDNNMKYINSWYYMSYEQSTKLNSGITNFELYITPIDCIRHVALCVQKYLRYYGKERSMLRNYTV